MFLLIQPLSQQTKQSTQHVKPWAKPGQITVKRIYSRKLDLKIYIRHVCAQLVWPRDGIQHSKGGLRSLGPRRPGKKVLSQPKIKSPEENIPTTPTQSLKTIPQLVTQVMLECHQWEDTHWFLSTSHHHAAVLKLFGQLGQSHFPR